MPKQYPEALKKQAVVYYDKTHSLSQTAQKYGIATSTVHRWVKDYINLGNEEEQFTLAEFKTLKQHSIRNEHLLEIIRWTKLLDEIDLQKKLCVLAKLYEQTEIYSVHELCDALNVSRGTFYNHIFRKTDRTKYLEERTELSLKIQEIFDESEQRYGAKKICAVLAANGIRTSQRRVKEIMNELGLKSIRDGSKNSYYKQEKAKRNLLAREFKAERINEKWVSDITYFKVNNYGIYLCVIIDLFSRRVIGYKISRKNSTHLVTATFKQAFKGRNEPKGLTFHSDRGCQYISTTFRDLLESVGVTQSFSHAGQPLDNAVAESFFSNFKREEAYRRNYTSENDFKKSVQDYIEFYNTKRPHASIAYKTPVKFEELYGNKKDTI